MFITNTYFSENKNIPTCVTLANSCFLQWEYKDSAAGVNFPIHRTRFDIFHVKIFWWYHTGELLSITALKCWVSVYSASTGYKYLSRSWIRSCHGRMWDTITSYRKVTGRTLTRASFLECLGGNRSRKSVFFLSRVYNQDRDIAW